MYDAGTRAAYPFLDSLAAAASRLRQEALSLPEDLWLPARGYADGVDVAVFLAERFQGEFTAAGLAAVRAACPEAARVVGTIPGARLAGYQRFRPGATMAVHTDPRADQMVRCILGLQLPALERTWWAEGTARLLDTRVPHWARNDDGVHRLTLVVDVHMPFVVDSAEWGPWRPDAPITRPEGVSEAAYRAARAAREPTVSAHHPAARSNG